MKRAILIGVVCALMATPAIADLYEPGFYAIEGEASSSWKYLFVYQAPYGGSLVHYQARICPDPTNNPTGKTDEYGRTITSDWLTPGTQQEFRLPPGQIFYFNEWTHPGAQYDMGTGLTRGMWAAGPGTNSNHKNIKLGFEDGTHASYPYEGHGIDSPAFLLQMQAYGYTQHMNPALEDPVQLHNQEFYCDGIQFLNPGAYWGNSGSGMASGYFNANGYPNVCGPWALNEPVPVPGAVLLGVLGLGVAGVKLRRFA